MYRLTVSQNTSRENIMPGRRDLVYIYINNLILLCTPAPNIDQEERKQILPGPPHPPPSPPRGLISLYSTCPTLTAYLSLLEAHAPQAASLTDKNNGSHL